MSFRRFCNLSWQIEITTFLSLQNLPEKTVEEKISFKMTKVKKLFLVFLATSLVMMKNHYLAKVQILFIPPKRLRL